VSKRWIRRRKIVEFGDWLWLGERKYGETYTQAIEATGLAASTLQEAKWVAGAFESCERSQALSWSHHKETASLPPDTRREVLASAAAEGLTTREVKALSRQERNRLYHRARLELCRIANTRVKRHSSFAVLVLS